MCRIFVGSDLPTGLLDARQVASEGVHSKLELQDFVSFAQTFSRRRSPFESRLSPRDGLVGAKTYSAHSEVPENTLCNTSRNTSVLDLRRSCVAVHAGEFELRCRSYSLGKRCVLREISKSVSGIDVSKLSWIEFDILTVPARTERRPYAWCGRE